jgi:hypothetical protein
MECFRDAAAAVGVRLRMLAVDVEPTLSAACAMADRALRVPRCTKTVFAAAITDIVRAERIQLIVPTIDTELAAYAAGTGAAPGSGRVGQHFDARGGGDGGRQAGHLGAARGGCLGEAVRDRGQLEGRV